MDNFTRADDLIQLHRAIVRVDVARDTAAPVTTSPRMFRIISAGDAALLREQLETADKALRNAHAILANAIEALKEK